MRLNVGDARIRQLGNAIKNRDFRPGGSAKGVAARAEIPDARADALF